MPRPVPIKQAVSRGDAAAVPMARGRDWVGVAMMCIVLGAAGVAFLQCAGSRAAARARVALRAAETPGGGRGALDAALNAALAEAKFSLTLYPWSPQALHTANVVLKRQGAWRAIAEDCAAARAWNVDAVTIARLEAEARWQLGEKPAAGEAAWRALALEPMPKRSASQIWRLAMNGTEDATRRRAAAWFVLESLAQDAETPEGIKAATRGEAEGVLR